MMSYKWMNFLLYQPKGYQSTDINPRNKEVGHMCLIGNNVPQKFFDWFSENVTYQTVKNIRNRFNPLSTSNTEEGELSINQEVCIWGDSYIPYAQHMMAPECVKVSMKRSICFVKIGAKITKTSQPLNLAPFFKILKKSGRDMTTVVRETPLSIIVDIIFKKLRKDKLLVFLGLKEKVLKDFISTSPEMISASFSKHSLIQSFVSSGMIDDKTKTCADIYVLINSFKIYWFKVKGEKNGSLISYLHYYRNVLVWRG